MKIQNIATPLVASDDMPTSVMGMDKSGMEMASFYLRDKIYSDKVLAVIREYICNAIDEHVKYRIDRPVEVTVTENALAAENIFSVRDFAKGLSENNIRNIFGMYFRSTKNQSNEQIGGFGIGSKAAHCYTDTFYVKSFHKGTCTLYACSLGAGSSGVSVGQILKVSEEPTEESGIEISLEIKKEDISIFKYKSLEFIKFCNYPIIFNNQSDVSNLTPVDKIEKDGFIFKLYNVSNYDSSIFLQMGNVIYQKNSFNSHFKNSKSIKKDHTLVIEIPIGKMSIPISRENFENTPANQRVLKQVHDICNELETEELQSFSNITVDELINSREFTEMTGKFLNFSKMVVFSDIYPVVGNLRESDMMKSLTVEKKNDKFVVAIIPNKESANYWRDKLINHSKKIGKNFYMIGEEYLSHSKINVEKLSKYFFFKQVKSSIFGWEKTSKSKADKMEEQFVFRHRFDRWSPIANSATALELHNIMRKMLNLPEAQTIDEAKIQMKNMTFTSRKELARFTVYHTVSTTGRDDCISVQSKQMRDNLISLGWLDMYSQEFNNIVGKINEQEKIQQKIHQQLENCKLKFLENSYVDKLYGKLKKKEKYARMFNTILEKIRSEKTFRGKLFKSLEDSGVYWWNHDKFTRTELRKVMKAQ